MNKKAPEIEPPAQEFTLPFVGREEELKFLLDEYDQMLHAQYRSVWIEAPAGVGKTTLVEEFLRRIDVAHPAKAVCATSWIVHAHLRERSSNSLASFVEALGVTLQTLTEAQREKLFGGLTSFYEGQAKKIVGGGNVQSMDMEKSITTAGYILKQLSKYFPLVVIIEDIHVLKGDMSFYALRHLQAILEHVPAMMVYISRPSDEKHFSQYQEQVVKEGCRKYKVESLKYEDVAQLAAGKDEKEIKDLLHLSGGNALLLRELLRSGDLHVTLKSNSTAMRIVEYLERELEKLPKRDRQTAAIAGMLGEEFSEQLLEEIARAKEFHCWSGDVVQRLEKKGILGRRKKVLETEGGQKKMTLRISVFSHALWWEAARTLYEKEKTWTDKKFAETIIPLLSHSDYPLLTDAELIVKLLRAQPPKKLLPLIEYIDKLDGITASWHFHSPQEHVQILAEVRRVVGSVIKDRKTRITKNTMFAMTRLIDAERYINSYRRDRAASVISSYQLQRKLFSGFIANDEEILREDVALSVAEVLAFLYQYGDDRPLIRARSRLKKQREKCHGYMRTYIDAFLDGLEGYHLLYRDPEAAVERVYQGITKFDWEKENERNFIGMFFRIILYAPSIQKQFAKFLDLARKFREMIARETSSEMSFFLAMFAYQAEINLSLRIGEFRFTDSFLSELDNLIKNTWHMRTRLNLMCTKLTIHGYCAKVVEGRKTLDEIFSDTFSLRDDASILKDIAGALFFLEEWDQFDELWRNNKNFLLSLDAARIFRLLRIRALWCLLLGRSEEADEAIKLLNTAERKYPLMKSVAISLREKLLLFSSLREKKIDRTKKDFESLLETDDTLSLFDKAHYNQLFARIGVRYGHDPKDFVSYALAALKTFEQLGLPERVVFTAEKFAEANLISQERLREIKKKYKASNIDRESSPSYNPKLVLSEVEGSKIQNSVLSLSKDPKSAEDIRITINCFGPLSILGPDGKEIITRYWGKRKRTPSKPKQIILELLCANFEGKGSVTRDDLLTALYPEKMEQELSGKKLFKLQHRLTSCLSDLKNVFSPHHLVEKKNGGYTLDPSVSADIHSFRYTFQKAKTLEHTHAPSALWLFQKIRKAMEQGEFASGFYSKGILQVRKEMQNIYNHSTTASARLRNKVLLRD